MHPMRILITGGSGLIGRALASELSAHGHTVTVLSRDPSRAKSLLTGVQIARWDARTAQGWGHLADGARAIVNLAGESIAAGRWTPARKRRIRDSRLNAGLAVVQAVQAVADKPSVVVQSSGAGYYGLQDDQPLDEDAPPGDDYLARVAVDWEAATAPLDALGIRRPILRTGMVLANHGGALVRLRLPFQFFVGGPLGGGRQWWSWIHLADEVRAIRFLIEHPTASGPFNLTAPKPLTNAAFSRVLGQVMRRPALMPIPGWAVRLLLGEMATVVLGGQRVLPRRLSDLGFEFRFPEARAALCDLLSK